jgi:hypothetical protein
MMTEGKLMYQFIVKMFPKVHIVQFLNKRELAMMNLRVLSNNSFARFTFPYTLWEKYDKHPSPAGIGQGEG